MVYSGARRLWFLSSEQFRTIFECPGKRAESWINVCSFWPVIKKKRCLWRTCVVHTKFHALQPIAGSTVITKQDRKASLITAVDRIAVLMRRWNRLRTRSLHYERSTHHGARGSSRQGWRCCNPMWHGLQRARLETSSVVQGSPVRRGKGSAQPHAPSRSRWS